MKRTTGIPRSFLRTVEEDNDPASDGLTGEKKTPSNIMVNAEGKRVEAIPDIASWEQYRAKAEAATAQKDESLADSKELEDRGLACPIDKHLFVDPHKTPCCNTTYCHHCIEVALFDSDFKCPNCGEQVLLEEVEEDEDAIQKVKEYESEKASRAKISSVNKTSKSPEPRSSELKQSLSPPAANPKKRAAEGELPNDRQKTKSPTGSKPQSPKVTATSVTKGPEQKISSPSSHKSASTAPRTEQDFEKQMNELAKEHGFSNQMNNMTMPMPNGFPFPMPGMPGMNGMPNPAMMQMMQNGMNPYTMGMAGMPNMTAGNQGGMNFNPNGNTMNGVWNNNGNMNGNTSNQSIPTGPKAQRTPFSHQQASRGGEDDAYMRKPLNPHRAAYRTRRNVRPMDFKEL